MSSFKGAVSLREAIETTYNGMTLEEQRALDDEIQALCPPLKRMKTTPPKIPSGDQLREAWLEAVSLCLLSSDLLSKLDDATTLANDGNKHASVSAKMAKETIHQLTTKALQVRDMITVWQAWASENSTID